jgi:hypothetical protein
MAENVQTDIVQTVFTMVDKVTAPLRSMQGMAKQVSGAFDKASGMLGTLGVVGAAVAGGLSFKHAVKETMHLLDNVKKVKDMTGLGAEEAGGLLDAMEGIGIAGEQGVGVLTQMSRVGYRMEMSMSRVHGYSGGMTGRFRQLGIDINKGPQVALMRMAELAKENKLSVQDMNSLFRIGGDQSRKFMNLLKQGPEHLHEMIEEFKKYGIATEENVALNVEIGQLQRDIAATWGTMQMAVAVRFLPVIKSALLYVKEHIGEWTDTAVKFGETLGRFLREHMTLVVGIGKAMMVNFLLMKATGSSMGGWVGKGAGMVGGMVGPMPKKLGSGIVESLEYGLLRPAISAGTKVADAARAPITAWRRIHGMLSPTRLSTFSAAGTAIAAVRPVGGVSGVLQTIGGVFNMRTFGAPLKLLFNVVNGIWRLRPVLFALGRMAMVGGAFAFLAVFVLETFKMIKDNVNGMRYIVENLWAGVQAHLDTIVDLLDDLFGGQGAVRQFFGDFIPMVFAGLTDVVNGLFTMIEALIILLRNLKDNFVETITSPLASMADAMHEAEVRQAWRLQHNERLGRERAVAEVVASRRRAPEEREHPPIYDFRGSRFDITQEFAEGFDPDRVAVALKNDLATVGERKLMSGFSPLYALR